MQKILFCDNSITDLDYLKYISKNADCVLIYTKTGNEAIKKAKAEKPDVIYMDILSLGSDGYSIMLSLRNDPVTKSIPIVFYSSQHQKADDILTKMQNERKKSAEPCVNVTRHEHMIPGNFTTH
ncbi:MAG: response regulator [Gammaproteobacteria bacterium]